MFLISRSIRPSLAKTALLCAGGALLLAVSARPVAAQNFLVSEVVKNLDNPHGVTFGPDGALYVVEAGRGGSGPSFVNGNGETQFYGTSGGVTKLQGGVQTRIASGLPSLALANGSSATGLHDIAFDSVGNPFVVVGLGGSPAARGTGPFGAVGNAFGQLARLNANGTLTNFADIAGFEGTNNPDGGVPDSNPFGLTAYNGGFLVADAGANAIFQVSSVGVISTFSVLPALPNPLPFGPPVYQSVPTTVAISPSGDVYVSQLTGFPFPVGAAGIYRIPAGGGTATLAYSGFTNVVDMAFGSDGSLYVLEYDSDSILGPGASGALIRIAPNGIRTTLVNQGLFNPTGLALGNDGSFYVSNFGTTPQTGSVIRLTSVPEPGTIALVGTGLLPLLGAVAARRRRRRTGRTE